MSCNLANTYCHYLILLAQLCTQYRVFGSQSSMNDYSTHIKYWLHQHFWDLFRVDWFMSQVSVLHVNKWCCMNLPCTQYSCFIFTYTVMKVYGTLIYTMLFIQACPKFKKIPYFILLSLLWCGSGVRLGSLQSLPVIHVAVCVDRVRQTSML